MKYSLPARFLHWSIAGLIVCQYVLAKLAERAELIDNPLQQLALLANHKSIGMSVLMLAVVRIVWRSFNRPPPLLNMPSWQHRASTLAHWSLYALILLLPVTGWLMSSAKAYSVSWFNLFSFVDLITPNESAAERFLQFHHWLGEALLVLAVIHILAALKHHFWDKDGVLMRMASKGGWLIFLLSISCLIMLTRISTSTDQPHTSSRSTSDVQAMASSHLPIWKIDYSDSFIKFSGDQAGAPFEGQWQRWTADIQFAPEQLQAGRFEVRIDTNSVFSNDDERDSYIVGVDFFNTTMFPEAIFSASQFSSESGGQFKTEGKLTMKGLTHPGLLNFSVVQNADKVVLIGTAKLDRLKWNIGIGDWADASWVGTDVRVQVRVSGQLDK